MGLTLSITLIGCESDPVAEGRLRALEAERDALVEFVAATEPASDSAAAPPVVPFADLLVVLRERLIADMIRAVLPFERRLSDRYRVRVETADVRLRPGIALVELGGRASLVDEDDDDVFADISLVGAFEVESADVVERGLSARVRIFGVGTREVGVGSVEPPAERLVDEIARLRAAELNRILGAIPIPVFLDEVIQLPAVEEEAVTIPEALLALTFRLDAVRVLEEGVFISLGVEQDPYGAATAMGGIPVEER